MLVARLIEDLKDENPAVHSGTVRALSMIGAAAVPALIDALKDENPAVRSGAAAALGDIK